MSCGKYCNVSTIFTWVNSFSKICPVHSTKRVLVNRVIRRYKINLRIHLCAAFWYIFNACPDEMALTPRRRYVSMIGDTPSSWLGFCIKFSDLHKTGSFDAAIVCLVCYCCDFVITLHSRNNLKKANVKLTLIGAFWIVIFNENTLVNSISLHKMKILRKSYSQGLNHKQLETPGYITNPVATDVLGLKHQAIIIPSPN